MSDILTAILEGGDLVFPRREALEAPCSQAEQRTASLLDTLDAKTAWNLRDDIQILTREHRDEAFLSGVRFGVRLMRELTAEDQSSRTSLP